MMNQDAAPPQVEVLQDADGLDEGGHAADGAPAAGAGAAGAGAALLNVHVADNHHLHDNEAVQALAAAFQQSLDDAAASANEDSDAWNSDDEDALDGVLDDIQWFRGLANNNQVSRSIDAVVLY